MQENQPSIDLIENDFDLLGLLVTLAENIKLLVIAPIMVGLCALGIAYFVPLTYDSVAVIQAKPSTESSAAFTEQQIASLMTTAAVLDPVLQSMGLYKEYLIEESRSKLREDLKVSAGRNDKLVTLTASAQSSAQAQALAQAILKQTFEQTRPKNSEKARLESLLVAARARSKTALETAANLSKRIESTSTSAANVSEIARGYAELLTFSLDSDKQINSLENLLEGVNESYLLQPPTLPQKTNKPRRLMIVLSATIGAGILLLLFVVMRQLLRDTSLNATSAEKIARIRRALGMKA